MDSIIFSDERFSVVFVIGDKIGNFRCWLEKFKIGL